VRRESQDEFKEVNEDGLTAEQKFNQLFGNAGFAQTAEP
jgi:hypothetical protein